MKKEEYKFIRITKKSWKYLKYKSVDNETSILQEIENFIKKEVEGKKDE